jgi:hypothetical protein
MVVEKLGNLSFQRESAGRGTHRSSVLKEDSLDFGRKAVPLYHHRRAEILQDALFGGRECNIWSDFRSRRRSQRSALVVPTTEGLARSYRLFGPLFISAIGLSDGN